MTNENKLWQVCFTIVIGVILLLVVGQLLGQPVLLSYVETDSMSPTMEPGDGFIPIPAQIAGPVEEGDVITFEAKKLHGGGLTTHRVVGETEHGYITRGDGNPFTDQDGDEPPVKKPQIVATALKINDQVVVIPNFGTGIEGIQSVLDTTQRRISAALGIRSLIGSQGLAVSIFATSLLWYVIGERRADSTAGGGRDRSRKTGFDTRLIVGICTLLLVLTATAAMVVPAGTQEYGIVSADFESDQPTVIPQGESAEVGYPVDNSGLVPIISYIEPASEGVAVQPTAYSVQPRSTETATVRLDAPAETGYYRRYVVEHRYLAVLPSPVIRSLYAIHPWIPIIAIDTLLGVPFYLVGRRLVGTGRLRIRTRSREIAFTTRLYRLVTSLYR